MSVRRSEFAFPVRAALLALASACSVGCVAVDVGAPVPSSTTRTVWDTARTPSSTRVTDIRPVQSAPEGKTFSVGFQAGIREEYPRTSRIETTTTIRQKRLAYGFFPGAAEQYCMPAGAERSPCLKHGYPAEFFIGLLPAGLYVGFGTVYSLLWEGPFGSYDCSDGKNHNAYSHVGLLGVHKYTAVTRKRPELGPLREEPPDVRTRTESIPGPYDITLSIDSLNYRQTLSVPRYATSATFTLPEVSRDRNLTVSASIAASSSVLSSASPWVRDAFATSAGKTYAFTHSLKAPPPPPEPVRVIRDSPPPPVIVVEQRTSPPPKPLYDTIRKVYLDDGNVEVRVKVNDTSRTFDIDREVQPRIREMFRQEFIDRNPLVPQSDIRVAIRWDTDRSGTEMVYVGGAFSLRPEKAEGTGYDSESKRGTLRLRVSGNVPEDILRRYIRDNISAVVSEKNVLQEAWKAPPSGATYRSLGEHYENGVLTIEYTAEN